MTVADTDTSDTEAKKPVTRRRAPRQTSAPKPTTPAATKKPVATTKPVPVTKPAAEKPTAATPRKVAAKPAPKPRSTKRATPRPSSTRLPIAQSSAKATDKIRGKWGAAAIFSGVAVVGAAAVGALLTLRGSTPKQPRLPAPDADSPHAHQADGTDSSKSFEAGIADEGTIPE